MTITDSTSPNPPVKRPYTTNLVYQNTTLPGYSGVAGVSPAADAQGHATTATATVSGQTSPLTVTFTWKPAQGQTLLTDPPPTAAIVYEACTASCHTNINYGPVTGSCADGLGGSASVVPPATDAGTHSVKYVAGVVAGDGGVSVPGISPNVVYTVGSGTGVGSRSNGNALVTYNPTITPVTISLQGATADPNAGNALRALTGQQITATLNSPYPVTSYSWSFSGATSPNPFAYWDPDWPQTTYPTQFVPLTSTQLTSSSLSFYDAHGNDSVTVQCTATIQPPSGPALTVTAKSRPITYVKPTVSWTVGRGYNSLSTGFVNDLYNQRFGVNELWGPITITDPPLFYKPSNPNTAGFGVLVQIASANRSNTRAPLNGKPATYSKISVLYASGATSSVSSPTGLDGAFPYYYGFNDNHDGTFTLSSGNYGWLAYNDGYSGDMPRQNYLNSDQDGGGNAWNASAASDSFDTWVMYRPASVSGSGQGTIYVPLQKLTWSWGGTANLSQYNLWSVSQTQAFIQGTPSNTDAYPTWNTSIPLNPNIGP